MPVKSNKMDKLDVLKEAIWTLLIGVAAFIYWVAMLLALTFVFNSIISLSFETVIMVSLALSLVTVLWRVIKISNRSGKENSMKKRKSNREDVQ